MNLTIDARSPIPIRRQLTEQLKHAIESAGAPRDQALPSIREMAGFHGLNTSTVARVIEALKRSGHVEARRARGVFVAPAPPAASGVQRRLIGRSVPVIALLSGAHLETRGPDPAESAAGHHQCRLRQIR
jgi:GntR family transcriptional regulator